ncbi:MAG: hypothetical protein EXS11_07980 [Gemmataceae bacterium]|nr:hypothetical protein [Gemmataceae bacterium]
MRFVSIVLWFTTLAIIGCGGENIVPVSGKVTVDGKPHKGLIVSFQPLRTSTNINPGRGSAAVTDASGAFTLVYDGTSPGAIVGKHRIKIFTQMGAEPPPEDTKSESDPKAFNYATARETIPIEWHERSEKEFEVPAGGTREANFTIELRKKNKAS